MKRASSIQHRVCIWKLVPVPVSHIYKIHIKPNGIKFSRIRNKTPSSWASGEREVKSGNAHREREKIDPYYCHSLTHPYPNTRRYTYKVVLWRVVRRTSENLGLLTIRIIVRYWHEHKMDKQHQQMRWTRKWEQNRHHNKLWSRVMCGNKMRILAWWEWYEPEVTVLKCVCVDATNCKNVCTDIVELPCA